MNRKSESKVLLNNTITFGIGILASKIIMLLLLPMYTENLSQGQLGVGEIVVSTASLLLPFATISIQSALLRFSMGKENAKSDILKITLLVSLVGCTGVYGILLILDIKSSINEWKTYLYFLLLAQALFQTFSVYVKAIGKSMLFSLGSIFYTCSLMIYSILLIKIYHRGISGYIEALILAHITGALFFLFFAKIYQQVDKSRINWSLLKSMIIFSAPLVINSVSWWISNFCDRYVLEYFISAGAVGIYSVAAKIPALISSISSVFMQAWTLSAIREYEKGNNKEFYSSVFELYSCIVFLTGAIIIAMIKPFMMFFVGKDFVSSWEYIPVLLIGAIFSGISSFFGNIYTAAKRNTGVMITTLAGAGINILLNLVLIPKLGIHGAVTATMLSYFLIALFRMIDSKKYLNFRIKYQKLCLAITIISIETLSLFKIQQSWSVSGVCIFALILVYWGKIKYIITQGSKLIRKIIRKRS